MKVGDLVKSRAVAADYYRSKYLGLILEMSINMWGEEVDPSGVKVIWMDGHEETVWGGELEVVDESR